jgi:two-component system, OmpR family, sensor histidine kinase VanS
MKNPIGRVKAATAACSNERLRNDHAGVGLGLTIVKRITQVHDGSLRIIPSSAGGLRIAVQLPTSSPHTTK